MNHRNIKVFVSALFIAHVLIGHIGVSNLVVCFGFDGHVALEYSQDSITCSDNGETPFPAALPVVTAGYGSDCHSCLDFPLTGDCEDIAKIQARVSFAADLMAIVEYLPAPSKASDFPQLICQILPRSTSIEPSKSLQTTVLLI